MITGQFGERAAKAMARDHVAETSYAMEGGVLVGKMPSPSDGDLSGILDKVRDATARVQDIRRRLDEKGDQVFGAVPCADASGTAQCAPVGGVANIYDSLDSLLGEMESLKYAAQRFDRL